MPPIGDCLPNPYCRTIMEYSFKAIGINKNLERYRMWHQEDNKSSGGRPLLDT